MQYKVLGNTGLTVSVAGLGCGGNSRLGQSTGKSQAESIAVVRRAVELGVNLIDTAAAYGTEGIVGAAIAPMARETLVISSKALIRRGETLLPAKAIVTSLEQSLRHLQTDYIDIFHLHAVPPTAYTHALEELVPVLLREKEKGKIRHLGITETPPNDAGELMLQRAVHDDCWEVFMLAFHMLNQNARVNVFPRTHDQGIGTLLMFVVRSIFSFPGRLQTTMKALVDAGRVPSRLLSDDPLGFLVHAGGADSVIDAAYRFARHEPGADVVLFGTGEPAHVEANIASILKPPLPREDVQTLYELFGHLQGVGLDLPMRR